MPEDQLSDRESLVLALFRYGLARDPEEVARQLRLDFTEAVRLCSGLAGRGFIQLASAVTAQVA